MVLGGKGPLPPPGQLHCNPPLYPKGGFPPRTRECPVEARDSLPAGGGFGPPPPPLTGLLYLINYKKTIGILISFNNKKKFEYIRDTKFHKKLKSSLSSNYSYAFCLPNFLSWKFSSCFFINFFSSNGGLSSETWGVFANKNQKSYTL